MPARDPSGDDSTRLVVRIWLPDRPGALGLGASRIGATGADIVGGPQVPVFESGDNRLGDHPVFAAPYKTTGKVDALYSSGNLLISKKVLQRMGPPFLDLRFNFTGGEGN